MNYINYVIIKLKDYLLFYRVQQLGHLFKSEGYRLIRRNLKWIVGKYQVNKIECIKKKLQNPNLSTNLYNP